MNINSKEISKQGRPKLNIPKSNLERVLDIISLFGVIIIWIYLIASWRNIPHQIPTHFGFSGKADSWGGKGAILIFPIVQSALYILLSMISKIPQHFNYVINITEENAERQYKNARTLLSWLLAEITITFLYLEWQSIRVAIDNSTRLGAWFLPVFLVILFGTLGIYIHRMLKLK